jgi:DNA-binding SARP family transcriptional activator
MLGPLEVWAGSGELLEVGGPRLRTLLIMLALRPGQLVPASQLIDGLWPDHPPPERRTRCRPWCPACAARCRRR